VNFYYSVISGHKQQVTFLATIWGDHLVSSSPDKTIRVWNSVTGKCVAHWNVANGDVEALAVCCNSCVIAVAFSNPPQPACVWDPLDEYVMNLGTKYGNANSVVACGDVLVVGSDQGTVQFWK